MTAMVRSPPPIKSWPSGARARPIILPATMSATGLRHGEQPNVNGADAISNAIDYGLFCSTGSGRAIAGEGLRMRSTR